MSRTSNQDCEQLQALNAEMCDALREACALIERLSAELRIAEQTREQTVLLSRELTEHLRASSIDKLSARQDHLERLVTGLFEGRIWRTLTFLASPLKVVSSLRSKVSS